MRLCSRASHANVEYAIRQIRDAVKNYSNAWRLQPYYCRSCRAYHVRRSRPGDAPYGLLLTFLIEQAEHEDRTRHENP